MIVANVTIEDIEIAPNHRKFSSLYKRDLIISIFNEHGLFVKSSFLLFEINGDSQTKFLPCLNIYLFGCAQLWLLKLLYGKMISNFKTLIAYVSSPIEETSLVHLLIEGILPSFIISDLIGAPYHLHLF